MKKTLLSALCTLMVAASVSAQSVVYQTRNISPEALVKIYKALGVEVKPSLQWRLGDSEAEKATLAVASPVRASSGLPQSASGVGL